MRIKSILFSLLIALAGFAPVQVIAQQDEDVRGSFMTTRPNAASNSNRPVNTRPNRRRPKRAATDPTVVARLDIKTGTVPKRTGGPRMGLGLTLFMRNSNGVAVRTDPSHEFHKGDHVRVLLETNTEGYLYIFNTTDNGQPVMIYPDPELDEAGNFIQAHVPFEIPSSIAAEERLRWFTFDQNAGIEKLYFIFARAPLPIIPIEDDLISFCRDNRGKCPLKPAPELWALVQRESREQVQVVKTERVGVAQTSGEHQAVTRGIGLNRDDPEPSVITLTASTSKDILVTTLELVHKSVTRLHESQPAKTSASQ
jgi:hypothetical protein